MKFSEEEGTYPVSKISEICSGNLILENPDNQSGFVTFDNGPGHRRVEEMEPQVSAIRRLPKYSPFLNPAENAISC